jgi:hypothetical protein
MAAAAWAGEESRHQGEAGVPSPLSRGLPVRAEEIRVHIAIPPPRETSSPTTTVRSEVKLRKLGKEPVEFEVGFPVAYPHMPVREYPLSYPYDTGYRVTTVKLDGEPIPAKLLFYADLAEPQVAEWISEIERHLGHLPELYEPGNRADLWERNPERTVQGELAELDPEYARISLYKQLSEDWGHAELMVNPFSGQLIESYGICWHRPFGAVVFPVTLETDGTHTLVVHHRQRLGMERNYYRQTRFVALRYVLTRMGAWGGLFETTIDVTVPDGWEKVVTRPPPGQVIPTESGITYRIRMARRPLEELYVAAGSRRP